MKNHYQSNDARFQIFIVTVMESSIYFLNKVPIQYKDCFSESRWNSVTVIISLHLPTSSPIVYIWLKNYCSYMYLLHKNIYNLSLKYYSKKSFIMCSKSSPYSSDIFNSMKDQHIWLLTIYSILTINM